MSNTTYQLIALAIYFAAMVGIGIWAKSKNNNLDDYVLGGRSLSPLRQPCQRVPRICQAGSSWVYPVPSTSPAWLKPGLPSA